MFHEQYSELRERLQSITNSKDDILEVAAGFRALAATKNADDPEEAALVALARYGELCCFRRLRQNAKAASLSIGIARLYLRAAEHYRRIAPNICDAWEDHLANALQSYRDAIDVYRSGNEGSVAALLLVELGEAEAQFEQWHYAGVSFAEAADIAAAQRMPAHYVRGPVFRAVDAFCRADEFDAALELLGKVEAKCAGEKCDDADIVHAILLLLKSKYEECAEFAKERLDGEVAKLFELLCEASQKYQVAKFDAYLTEAKTQGYFNELEVSLFEMKLSVLSRCLELATSMTK